MPTKAGTTPDWQDLEKQAYDACREWPIWLMLRTRELEERLRKQPRNHVRQQLRDLVRNLSGSAEVEALVEEEE